MVVGMDIPFTGKIIEWITSECGVSTLILFVALIVLWRQYVGLVNKYTAAIAEIAKLIRSHNEPEE